MSIHEELIAKTLMAKPTTDEEWLNIDWDTRLITIPSTLTNIGVYNDKDTNRLYFRCPIEYGEFKIADFGIHVNYQNTGISTTKYDGDVYFVDDVESDGEYLTFSWLVGRRAYLEQGTTAFVVCCKVVDSDNNIVNELNTTLATLSVLEGLEVDANPEDYPDYLEALLKKVEAAETSAADAKTAAGNAEASAEDAQQAAESAVTTANEAKETADGIAGTAQNALDTAQAVAETAITGIKVNGEDAPVNNHVAEIEVSGWIYYTVSQTFYIDERSEWVRSTIPVDGTPIGTAGAWTSDGNIPCLAGEIKDGAVSFFVYSATVTTVTVYVNVLYAD